jgi:hypothetical protein
MRERKSFLLRLDPTLHAALEQWAQQELRSLNGQIEYLLKEAVARRRKTKKGEEEDDEARSL